MRLIVGSVAPFALATERMRVSGGLLITSFLGCGAVVGFAAVGFVVGKEQRQAWSAAFGNIRFDPR